MGDILITEMRPAMIDGVAQLHMAAFKGYTNTLIGLPYVRAFFRWFCDTEDAIDLCAIVDTKSPVGYVVGAPTGYATRLNKKIFSPAVTGILLRPWLVFNPRFRWIVSNRLRSLSRTKSYSTNDVLTLPSPTISLVGIGVHPDVRGKKVGQQLMAAFESRAVEAKARSMLLSVYPDNTAACKLYEKNGWQSFVRANSQTIYYYKTIG